MSQNSEIWGVKKIVEFFDLLKSALFGPANGESKI